MSFPVNGFCFCKCERDNTACLDELEHLGHRIEKRGTNNNHNGNISVKSNPILNIIIVKWGSPRAGINMVKMIISPQTHMLWVSISIDSLGRF